MDTEHPDLTHASADTALMSRRGLRLTRQRQEVLHALQETRDHPAAMDIFLRVKDRVPGISLATVYNSLETLVQLGLIRQVHLDRESTRYCANRHAHAHLFCSRCGSVTDAPITSPERLAESCELPPGSQVTSMELTLRGLCPTCSAIL